MSDYPPTPGDELDINTVFDVSHNPDLEAKGTAIFDSICEAAIVSTVPIEVLDAARIKGGTLVKTTGEFGPSPLLLNTIGLQNLLWGEDGKTKITEAVYLAHYLDALTMAQIVVNPKKYPPMKEGLEMIYTALEKIESPLSEIAGILGCEITEIQQVLIDDTNRIPPNFDKNILIQMLNRASSLRLQGQQLEQQILSMARPYCLKACGSLVEIRKHLNSRVWRMRHKVSSIDMPALESEVEEIFSRPQNRAKIALLIAKINP